MDYHMFQRKYLLGCSGKLGEVLRPYVPKKILTWMLREARGGLKATVGNRVKPDYHFISIFLFFFVSFSQILVFPGRLCAKTCQHILDIVDLSQAEV